MDVYVPYSARNPKSRLALLLLRDERQAFSRLMLHDVCDVLSKTRHTPIVLATEPMDLDVDTTVSTESLSAAVNSALHTPTDGTRRLGRQVTEGDRSRPVGVVMADLGLLTVDAVEDLFASEADLTIAPGQRGGTNALVLRSSEFRVDYHGASYLDHREIARRNGLTVTDVDSFRLACDIDVPDDLVELLLHGTSQASRYASERFKVVTEDGAVTVRRRVQVR